ncbi:hypothetical protein V5799_024815 [Amblyomma americanum]|uniref:Peptidase M13 N-terminal domain-containing protein n=1 Tax=Amblyomma americanum TaxID=6943 RepID=A0AAQ4EBC6_AMBAM
MRRNPRPIPVYLPSRGRQSSARRPTRPVATVVLNPTTGYFEFSSISAFPPGSGFTTSSPARRSRSASQESPLGASGSRRRVPSDTATSRAKPPSSKPSLPAVAYRPTAPNGETLVASSAAPRRLAKPVNSVRQGSQEYPVSSACALFTCCSLAVVTALGVGLYLFSQSREGQQAVTRAMRILSIGGKTTRPPTTDTTGRVDVRLKVDVLTQVADRAPTVTTKTTTRPTMKTLPPCKRLLCPYQTSRWALNSAAHPCDDFYSFVCGNWSQTGSNDTLYFATDQHKETEALLHTLLEQRRAADDVAASLYDTCNEHVSYADSKLFSSSLLLRLGLSKWPYRDNVMSKNEMWNIHSRIFRTLGISPLVSIGYGPDLRNISRPVVKLGIPPLYASDARLPSWYLPALYRATSMFDSDLYEDVSQRVLQFVARLAQLRARHGESLRWTAVGSEPFYGALIKHSFEGLLAVASDTSLELYNQAFFKALKSLISQTKSSSVYNYLGFCVLVHISPLLSDEFESMGRAQMAWMTQRWQPSWPLWQRCLWFIDDMDPMLLTGVFAKYARPHMRLVDVVSVTNNFHRVLRVRMSDLEWCGRGREKSCLAFINSTSIRVVDLTTTPLMPTFSNLTTGFFLEEYIRFKRHLVQASLVDTQSGWKSVLSMFSSSSGFDTKTKTLYLPTVSFFDLFHDADHDLLIRYPSLAHGIYKTLLEQLRRYLVTIDAAQTPRCSRLADAASGYGSVEDLALDSTAWELSFRHFSRNRWEGYVFPGNHSTERSFFILAAMGKCRSVAHSVQTAVRSEKQGMHLTNEAFANTRVFGNLWSCNNHTVMNPANRCNLWKS